MVPTSETGRNAPAARELFTTRPEKFRTRRVLIVDDEVLIRWALAEGFERVGLETREAGDARTALALLAPGQAPIDGVLLDLRLPDSRDLTLLERVRTLVPRAPVILMTAYGTPETAEGARSRGAYRVISKPFDLDYVITLMSEALGDGPRGAGL